MIPDTPPLARPVLPRALARLALAALALALFAAPLRAQDDLAPQDPAPRDPPAKALPEPPAAWKKAGAITFATDDSYAPMEYWERGQFKGYDVDLAREIAKKLGLEARFVSTPFADILSLVAKRRSDAAISSIDITRAREEQCAFVAYLTMRQVFVVTAGAARVATLDDLEGKRVALQEETTGVPLAKGKVGEKGGVRTFPTYHGAFDELRKGGADVVIVDEPVAAHRARAEPGRWLISGFATDGEPVGIALPKDDKEALAAVTAALEALKADGALEKLAAKWLKP